MHGNVEKKGKRKNYMRRGHNHFKKDLGLQGFNVYQKINIFVETGIISFYDKYGRIYDIHINNSEVTITSADGKLPFSANDPF